MKPKQNYKPGPMDNCGTPPYAVAPLIPYLKQHGFETVWEPASGEGLLAYALGVAGFGVHATDISMGAEYDFFAYTASRDAIVTNPPYSIKPKWLRRCYQLDKPFALLMPLETLGTASSIKQFISHHGFEMLILYPRVDFVMPNFRLFSSSQFPTAWFCRGILPEKLMFAELHKPKRTETRQVMKVNKKTGVERLVTERGYPAWIEKPSRYDDSTQRFVYEEEL